MADEDEYDLIELKISEEDADKIKALPSEEHLHFQINKNKEVMIIKK